MTARKAPAEAVRPASKRPFATYYYQGKPGKGDWSRIGRAATHNGAIRAALRHLLEGTAQNALVHDESAVVVARLSREGNIVRIVGVI
jgi:hypothetical protein